MKNTSSGRKAHSQDHLGEFRDHWWNQDFLALMAERLELSDCEQVADIGCGAGSLSFQLAPFLASGASLKGLDIEERHLKVARQKARKQKADVAFTFFQGTAERLPFADEEMDLTFCQTLLIHMENPEKVLEEMIRITREGGWVVAFEPNNLVSNLMFNSMQETQYNVEDMLQMLEVRLRCEKGKEKLGEGFSSLGGALPDLFHQAGLEDIQVWMSDKAMPLIPPYDNREKRVMAAQLIDWLENDQGGMGYDENLRYFKAGGGKKDQFDLYWMRLGLYKKSLLQKLKTQEFISSGGQVMYIVAGLVVEADDEE